MTETTRHCPGVLLAAGAAAWWSTGIIIRMDHTDSLATILWRSVATAATMFLFLAIRKRVAAYVLTQPA